MIDAAARLWEDVRRNAHDRVNAQGRRRRTRFRRTRMLLRSASELADLVVFLETHPLAGTAPPSRAPHSPARAVKYANSSNYRSAWRPNAKSQYLSIVHLLDRKWRRTYLQYSPCESKEFYRIIETIFRCVFSSRCTVVWFSKDSYPRSDPHARGEQSRQRKSDGCITQESSYYSTPWLRPCAMWMRRTRHEMTKFTWAASGLSQWVQQSNIIIHVAAWIWRGFNYVPPAADTLPQNPQSCI